MNANPEMPVLPDPLTLLVPASPAMESVRVFRERVVDVIHAVLYYGLLAVGVLIPIVGGIVGLISK